MEFCPVRRDLDTYERQQSQQALKEAQTERDTEEATGYAKAQAIPEKHRTEFISWAMFNRYELMFNPTSEAFYKAVESGEVELWD
jgi:hypothetical protein